MVRVDLIDYTKDGEKLVALAIKRSFSAKPAREITISDEEAKKLILETLKHGHWSPWEFSSYTFEVECSRVCTHQLVRHRIASYVQQSQRHTSGVIQELVGELSKMFNMPCNKDDYGCVCLLLENVLSKLNKTRNEKEKEQLISLVEKYFYIPDNIKPNEQQLHNYVLACLTSLLVFFQLLRTGVPLEDARHVLPQSINSRIVVTMNARELATVFLPLRMCNRAQQEIRYVAWSLWGKLKTVHPTLFSYVGPRCLLIENMVRPQPLDLETVLDESKKVEFTIPRCPEAVPRERIRSCIINTYKSTMKL